MKKDKPIYPTKDKDHKRRKKQYECKYCHNLIYYSRTYGWRCGVGCDKAVKGKEIL